MTTTPTLNPVPSEYPGDLKFNAGKIDEFVTSQLERYQDRFGNEHYTIEGLKKLILQHIYELGLNPVGSFQAGATLNSAGDIIQDTSTGLWYRWDNLASLPKIIPVGSTLASTGGVGAGTWQPVDVTDVLRRDLANTASGKGANLVAFNDPVTGATTVDAALKTRPTNAALLAGNGSAIGYRFASDSILRNFHDRFAETLSIMDYVQSTDGGDCSLALQRIFTKYVSADSFHIKFPDGYFQFKTQAV